MSKTMVDYATGFLSGENVLQSAKRLGQLEGVFADEEARRAMPQDTLVYEVQTHQVVEDGTEGGLLFGTSNVMPGKVGKEYFMTRGHFHARRACAEYYWCIQGKGALLLMDEKDHVTMQEMKPGTLHYIPGYVAHRLVNTGDEVLRVGACWPSDAGHDYGSIAEHGFSCRLLEVDGQPQLVRNENTENT